MSKKISLPVVAAVCAALSGCTLTATLRPTPTASATPTQTLRADQRTATAMQEDRSREASGTQWAETRIAQIAPLTLTAPTPTTLIVPLPPTPLRYPSPPGTPWETLSPTPESPVGTIQSPSEASSAETPTATPDGRILAFYASATAINPGESFTLTWEVASGEPYLCSIMRTGQFGTCEPVPLTGSRIVTTQPSDRNFVQWMLFINDGAGITAGSASVIVYLTCPTSWFFSPPPGDACPQEGVHSEGAAQHFERGLMIWLAATNQIFILYADDQHSPRWDVAQNSWVEGMPEEDPSIEPPPGLYEPIRGFGRAWRGEGFIVPRDRLGWASAAEFRIEPAYQCDSAPKYNTCYLLGPNGVIVLEPERSGWHLYAP